jgi:hypothetical protein
MLIPIGVPKNTCTRQNAAEITENGYFFSQKNYRRNTYHLKQEGKIAAT